jgi:multidrug efflux system outer membrane protein
MKKFSGLISLAALGLAGCVTGPDPVAPDLEAPDAYQTELKLNQVASPEKAWWEGFSDPALSELIETSLDQNLDIEIALANLERARAQVGASESDLFPSFDAFVDSEISSILTGGVEAEASATGGGVFSFDPDIAGRNKRALQGARARFEAARFTVEDIRRLTASSVANQYIALRRSGAAIVLLETSLDLQERTLEIVTARFDAGLSPALDVDRAAADLARTQSQSSLLRANRRSAEYALSVLVGEAPRGEFMGLPEEDIIPNYSAGPELGVPTDLLRRRPDIRAAEATLVAEIADIGVEQADLYPSLRLPGTISASRTTSNNGLNALTASLGAILDIPIFDAGRRRAEVDIQRAEADAALAQYKSTLLDAIRETETALLQIQALTEQKTELEKAVQSSQSAFNQLNALYREGLADFIDVLDSQRTLISSREAVVAADANIALAYIDLYTSVGYSE